MAPSVLFNFSSSGTSPTASSVFTAPSVAASDLDPSEFNMNGVDGLPSLPNGGSGGNRPRAHHAHTFSGISDASSSAPRPPPAMPIAIVGMACRMPGSVSSPAEFWELCSRARSGYTPVPKDRFNHDVFYHPNQGKTGAYHAQGGNFLNVDLAAFDAPFFGLTEKEAISMDPQQRLLLECAFEALENAGVPKHSIVGKDVGVFVGGSFAEYESHLFRDSDTIPMHQATGCAHAMQSNRLSHFFDLRGPSFTADTACSASLVALHLACQSLRTGECSQALVGSCHLNMLPEFWISFSTCRLLADSGRSISFDERGTGFGRGEGAGILVLKPLDQAIRDNDSIRAVIMGTGINQDGKTPGITMPNGEAQERLINQVYQMNGLDPLDCGYVEAHGTGTKVGDPIEATALHNALGQGRSAKDPLYVGSVKSNIGHLEAASGLAGVIKAALMLERGFILPNHDFKKPNQKIPWKEWNMKVPASQRPWPKGKKYISVNNFGFGGTNAHVVLAKAPFTTETVLNMQPPPHSSAISSVNGQSTHGGKAKAAKKLVVMTANDKYSLAGVMKKLVIYLEQRPEVFQADLMKNVAYTLGQRRSHLQWRLAVPVATSFELVDALNGGKLIPSKTPVEQLRIGFVFTGQGAQWYGMGRELYDQYPVYAAAISRADSRLQELGSGWSLVDELSRDAKTSRVSEAHISQPACTAVQLALTDLLRSFGVRPAAVAGHSSGEICAAYAAGIISFDSAVAIAYHRGRLIPVLKRKHPDLKGAMMAVGGSASDMQPMIDAVRRGENQQVRIACHNSPTSLTISGDSAALADLERVIGEEQPDTFKRRLQVDVAYHSHHMNLVADEYQDSIDCLPKPRSSADDVAFHSSLHGRRVDGAACTASYWVDNLTCPVRFSEALSDMLESKSLDDPEAFAVNALVEIGPHSALQGPIKQILAAAGRPKLSYASPLVRNKDAVDTALDLAGSLWAKGALLNMDAVNFPKPSGAKRPVLLTDLPRYEWNRSMRYWHESRATAMHKHRRGGKRSDLVGVEALHSTDAEPVWRNVVRLDDLPWLRHHQVQGLPLFPFAGFVGMALEAAEQVALRKEATADFDAFELMDVVVGKPLALSGDGDVEMTIALRPMTKKKGWSAFKIASWTEAAGWTEHCTGEVGTVKTDANEVDGERQRQDRREKVRLAAAAANLSERCEAVADAEMYTRLDTLGVGYGPTFQGIKNCKASPRSSAADIVATDVVQDMPNHYMTPTVLHPTVLESLIQLYWPVLGQSSSETVYLPSSAGTISIARSVSSLAREPGQTLRGYCAVSFPGADEEPRTTSVSILATAPGSDDVDSSSALPLIEIADLRVAPIVDGSSESEAPSPRELCYKLEWSPVSEPTSSEAQARTSESNSLPNAEVVIIHGDSSLQHSIARSLADTLERATSLNPAMGYLGSDGLDTSNKLCVVLTEIDRPFLADPSPEQFAAVQQLISRNSPQGILWAVRGGYEAATAPEGNMVVGLARTVRSETLLPFATVDLDPCTTTGNADGADAKISAAVLRALELAFGGPAGISCANRDMEFMERSGRFFTPKIVDDEVTNAYVHRETNPAVLEKQAFGSRPLRLAKASKTGQKGILRFVDDRAVEEDLGAEEVEFEVKAIGLGEQDASGSKGGVVGLEAAGAVTRVGSAVSGFRVGDRIAALTLAHGACSSHARTTASTAFCIPEAMSFADAAALPLASCVARLALLDQARLRKGETVLAHHAATAVGQAALRLAASRGASQIFATVSTAAEKELLITKFAIPEERIFHAENASLAASIKAATASGRGVDVVLVQQGVSADIARESGACLARFGRLVDVNCGGNPHDVNVTSSPANASYLNVDVLGLAAERPEMLAELVRDVAALVQKGAIVPLEGVTSFGISKLGEGLKAAAKPGVAGKVVVVPEASEMVMATPSKAAKNLLRPDASYLLIGGTGGLGRSMARWMVDNGARTVVLLSRSGSASGKVKELIDAAKESADASILVRRCDIADKASADELFNTGLADLPPVRGVVHGAMVLRDVLFEKMTHEDYTAVTESKVRGAWNFHHALQATGAPLDFFVAISSAAGAVGNRGQAAYAAANTFLNALVQYRLRLGLPASCLDLTAVSDAGYLADGDAERAAEVAKNLGKDSTISEAEVLALLGATIASPSSSSSSSRSSSSSNGKEGSNTPAHIITGMRIPPQSTKPFWSTDGKFSTLLSAAAAIEAAELAANGGGSSSETISPNAAVRASATLAEAEDAVCKGLVSKISSVLMMEADGIDITRSLSHYPLDSLVAIEIRNFITREFEANMQVLELLSSGSVQTLTKAVVRKSKLCAGLK